MASVLLRNLAKVLRGVATIPASQANVQAAVCKCNRRANFLIGSRRHYSVFEPDGLDVEPEIPEYEALSISMRGYDYVTLESFSKFIHNIVKNMGLDNDTYPTPARTCRVQTYKPFSTNIEHTYNLSMFERTVQVEDLPATMAPILLEIVQQNAPEGVNISVRPPEEDEDDFRYVPDIMLQELQSQVEELDQAREDRRKK